MEYRSLGGSGIKASVIGLGTWAIGGWAWGGTDETKSIEAIQASLEEGINLIDTAPAYGLGLSESVIGKAIAGCREKVILATKCGLVWGLEKGVRFFEEYGKPIHRYLGPDSIRHELEQSLLRLKTDYIDLYQTHWQDVTTPINHTMETLIALKQEGKIRAIGVSNCTLGQLQTYQKTGSIDSIQEKYSMLDREIEADILPYAQKKDLAVLAYSPLASGLLSGKIDLSRSFAAEDRRSNHPRFSLEARGQTQQILDRMRPLAHQYNLSMAQLVLAWTLAQPGVSHLLVGARNPQQARENARAGSITLKQEDLEFINDCLATPNTSMG